MGSSPASGSVLRAQSLEPASDSVTPSLPPPHKKKALKKQKNFGTCTSPSWSSAGTRLADPHLRSTGLAVAMPWAQQPPVDWWFPDSAGGGQDREAQGLAAWPLDRGHGSTPHSRHTPFGPRGTCCTASFYVPAGSVGLGVGHLSGRRRRSRGRGLRAVTGTVPDPRRSP